MPIYLTAAEKKLKQKLAEIKGKSGSHSPSPAMLRGISGVTVEHDFCFLSNPHATDLFLKYWRRDFGSRNAGNLRELVEQYPSQNRALAHKLKKLTGVSAQHIFAGNGATEVIQAVLHNFAGRKILVPVPTFSPYLEFVPKRGQVILHQLPKENNFRLDANVLLAQVKKEKPDSVVIINPNNPDGGFMNLPRLERLLKALRRVKTVVVDESFAHFTGGKIESVCDLVTKYPNLVVIKSLSKDFGIAGLRLGYGVMSERRVSALLERGYLWNVSGLGEYFLGLINNREFIREYEKARLLSIRERDDFFTRLSTLKGIKVYPSKANMFLIELQNGLHADDLTGVLLARYGVYIRSCTDKTGLRGEFVRIASRKKAENVKFFGALISILSK